MSEGGSGRSLQAVALAVFFVTLTALTVAGFAFVRWLPPVASEHGPGVDRMIQYLLVVTGVIFVVGHGVLVVFLWRSRRPEEPGYRPVSRRAEWLWAMAPVLVMSVAAEVGVLALGLPVWAKVYGPPPEDALVVEVVGKQFEWLVRYPGKDGAFGRTAPQLVHAVENPLGLDEKDPAARDDLVLRGALTVPLDRPVVVRLRSFDVLHSFSVPEFRIKQDVIPGFMGSTQFVPQVAGTYEIACAELCGLGHYRMRGFVHVKPPGEFEGWRTKQKGWFEE